MQSHDQEDHGENPVESRVQGIVITAVGYIAQASQHSGDKSITGKKINEKA